MQIFSKYKYNVKTCMYTISSLYQISNFNVTLYIEHFKYTHDITNNGSSD